MLCVGLKFIMDFFTFITQNCITLKILSEKLDELKGAEARYSKDLTLCRAKVNEFQISETKFESLCEKLRFNINNLVLNVRLYIQVNVLTSVADELITLNTLPFYISV
jgi:hypothetical protein